MPSETSNLLTTTQRSTNFMGNIQTAIFHDSGLNEYGTNLPAVQLSGSDGNSLQQESSTKSIVLGGIDGISASYLIVALCYGIRLHWTYFIILGLANIFANALSIGISEFFSSKHHRDFILAEKRRATWQYKNFRNDEIHEMARKLESKGMSKADAEIVVGKFAQYEEVFINFLIVEELGMNLPDEDEGVSLSDAFTMLVSYATFGSIPILLYALGARLNGNSESLFIISTVVTSLLLIVLGSVKSTFSSSGLIYTLIETLFTTAVCAVVAYSLSFAIEESLLEYM